MGWFSDYCSRYYVACFVFIIFLLLYQFQFIKDRTVDAIDFNACYNHYIIRLLFTAGRASCTLFLLFYLCINCFSMPKVPKQKVLPNILLHLLGLGIMELPQNIYNQRRNIPRV